MVWEIIDAPPEGRGSDNELGPNCDGPESHVWRLTIEEGRMGLTSGCAVCDDHVVFAVGGEDVSLVDTIECEIEFVPEHDNLGGWHGFERCDCGWWWNLRAKRILSGDES